MPEDVSALILSHSDMANRIAYSIARNYGVLPWVEDVKQAGLLGLVEAANHFRGDGAKFSTFMRTRVVGQILDEVYFLKGMKHRMRCVLYSLEWVQEEVLAMEEAGFVRLQRSLDVKAALEKSGLSKWEKCVVYLFLHGWNNDAIRVSMGMDRARVSQLRSSAVIKLFDFLHR